MKTVDFEDQEFFCPNNFQFDLLQSKNLLEQGKLSAKYLILQSFYKYLLEAYLDQQLDIKKYDQQLLNSPLQFQEVQEEEKDLYQKVSSFHYFYLRNTLYIEKLSVEQLNFLIERYNQQNFSLDLQMKQLLEQTLGQVITSNLSEEPVLTNYGPTIDPFFAPNNAIVLGVRYDPYVDDTLPDYNDDVWFENNLKQTQFLFYLMKEMKEEYAKKIDIPIQIIKYDEQSISKKKIDDGKVIK